MSQSDDSDDGQDIATGSGVLPHTEGADLRAGERTLACLIQGLGARVITIELTDETTVRGRIEAVEADLRLVRIPQTGCV